ncbi:MAG: LUD domain-containing protein [Halofilum sp. (in: g-proteobacteria)]|nr:LUD domain-containing protein [Halofilum sp. (in: g-proteobacteria)]
MSARDDILAAIRDRRSRPAAAEEAVAERLAAHPRGPLPAAVGGDREALRARFIERAGKASAEVEALAAAADLPPLAARLCREAGYPERLALAPDAALTGLDWAAAGLEAEARAARRDDRVCVSVARCGVAETGTLVLASGADSPVTLAFVPDLHLVLLQADAIVGAYEQAWDLLRAGGSSPRAVNWITGPSRSADIEQTLQLGAHGPIRLVIALL